MIDLTGESVEPLSYSLLFIRKRKSFQFLALTSRLPQQGLRYAIQAEVAFDRFLIAYLSRLEACDLLAKLMKDLASPTVTPGLNHSCTFPMPGIGEEKAGSVTQIRLLMHND